MGQLVEHIQLLKDNSRYSEIPTIWILDLLMAQAEEIEYLQKRIETLEVEAGYHALIG